LLKGKSVMSKKPKPATINTTLLKAIVAATSSGNHYFVGKEEGQPLLNHTPPLIVVNFELMQGDKAASRATEAGIAMVNGSGQATAAANPAAVAGSAFSIMKGVELPASRRGAGLHGGAPKKYPFEGMEVGDSFFVPVSEDTPNPLKTLGSTVSSANMRYAEEISGQTREVTRVKRGKDRKAVVENGEKVMETVTLPKYNFTRKFEIRGIEKGKQYGNWTAPESGALIARTK
jgi:hypothetical protein